MRYLLILLSSISFKSSVQQLPDFIAPINYSKVMEAKGDLDKDGTNEIIYVYNTDQLDGDVGFFRVLYICKLQGGKVKLWKKNTSVLRSSKDCGFCVDAGIDLSVAIKNNTLMISQTFNHNTRHFSTVKNIFRYQNGDWFLIGSTYNDYDTCDYDYKYDVNFSTKQVRITYAYGDCDEGKKIPKDEFYSFKHPFKSIPIMDGFKPGNVELKVPNTKHFFYY